jgi:4-amino-4-deoxy-L-arabinose transferase
MSFDYENYLSTIVPYFYSGFAVVMVSVIVFELTKRKGWALLLLVTGNLIMSATLSYMQPFLHMWDEQVHALVAKNMVSHPFKPMLFTDPHLDYSYKVWTGNHIWLHKQPWFLWQIALFFKIFGSNFFVLRLPSILMFSGLLLIIYRLGTIIKNNKTGFYAALMFAGSNFFYRLVTGALATDHNDTAFVFYVTASLWAWFEFENSERKHWLVLTGIFSGIAILNKWLPGLLVYSGWFLSLVFSQAKRKDIKNYLQLLYAFAITVAVALPWQIYILLRFPLESRYEYSYNSMHFFSTVEKHKGDYLFHINHITTLYGQDFQYVFYASLIILLFIKIKREHKIALYTFIITVYMFYSLAATKMLAFTFIVAPLVYIIVSLAINYILEILFKQKNRLQIILNSAFTILIFGFVLINFSHIHDLVLKNDKHTKKIYEIQISNTVFYKKLPQLLEKGNYEYFNCRNYDHIKIMFYTGHNAHGYLPTKKIINKLVAQNITPVVFDNGKLPQYIISDNRVLKIKSSIWLKEYHDKVKIYR